MVNYDSIDKSSRVCGVMHHIVLRLSSFGKEKTNLLLLLDLSGLLSASLLLALALLEKGLGDQDLVLGGNATTHDISLCPRRYIMSA